MDKKGKYLTSKQTIQHIKGHLKGTENIEPKKCNVNPTVIFDTTLKTQMESMMKWEEIYNFLVNRS